MTIDTSNCDRLRDESIEVLLDQFSVRRLQIESARALATMQATNNNIHQFNKQAHHDSQKWYRAVIKWYMAEYFFLPSVGGPGKDVKLILDD
jgi:hypothetical protein